MASLDVNRPAAMEQLAILGTQIGVDTLPIVKGESAVQIAKRAKTQASMGGYDVYIDGDDSYDYMGNTAAEGGDIDGDGYGDLVVGSYGYDTGGAAMLMYGPLSGVGNIQGASADVRFLGPALVVHVVRMLQSMLV